MHRLIIQHLAANHEHVNFLTANYDAGLGWVETVDELCKDLPSGTVVHWIRDIDGRLQVNASGAPIASHMTMAAWRRSAVICPHCGKGRHPTFAYRKGLD